MRGQRADERFDLGRVVLVQDLQQSVEELVADRLAVDLADQVDKPGVDPELAQRQVRGAQGGAVLVEVETVGVGHDVGHVCECPGTTGVLRRCRARAADRDGEREPPVACGLQDVLEADRDGPPVAVVVQVVQLGARAAQRLVEADLGHDGRIHVVGFTVLRVGRADEHLARPVVGSAADREPEAVMAGPAEGGLDDEVHRVERQVRAQVQAPPDLATGVVEAHAHAQHDAPSSSSGTKVRTDRETRMPGTGGPDAVRDLPQVVQTHARDRGVEVAQQLVAGVVVRHASSLRAGCDSPSLRTSSRAAPARSPGGPWSVA